jgi:hypothetical protein
MKTQVGSISHTISGEFNDIPFRLEFIKWTSQPNREGSMFVKFIVDGKDVKSGPVHNYLLQEFRKTDLFNQLLVDYPYLRSYKIF